LRSKSIAGGYYGGSPAGTRRYSCGDGGRRAQADPVPPRRSPLVPAPGCDRDETSQRLKRKFAEQFGPTTTTAVEFVEEIPRTPGRQGALRHLADRGPARRHGSPLDRRDDRGQTLENAKGGCEALSLLVGGGDTGWTVSRENVEIVRRVYEAVARRERQAVLALYAPGVEMDFTHSPFATLFNHFVYRGHAGILSLFRERQEDAWKDIVDELTEVIGAGEQVVSVVVSRGRGRVSGAEVEREHAAVWTARDGEIVRVVWLPSRGEALEAVGLPG
jgi:ketosteroid isomerase-like protein